MITSATSASTAAGAAGTATTSDALSTAGGKLGKDEFLKLLVAQLRNQDPTSPADGKEMAAQLAQFSSVEQLQNISATLTAQQSAQAASLNAMSGSIAMGTIGKTVLAAGDQFTMPAGGTGSVTFDVGGSGGATTVRVLDAAGKTVATRSAGFLSAGRHTFDLGAATAGLPAGTYRYAVEAVDGQTAVATQTYVKGRVDGVQYTSAGPVLKVGGATVPLGRVVEVKND